MINGETTGYPFGGKMKLYSFKFIFNWRITALQCCGGLCHTTMWIGHRDTRVPSLVNHPPTPLEYQLQLPVLHSTFPLAVNFNHGNVHVSRTLSVHPTLYFPCWVRKTVFYSCPVDRFISTIFRDSTHFPKFHTQALIYDICFPLSDLLHSGRGDTMITKLYSYPQRKNLCLQMTIF